MRMIRWIANNQDVLLVVVALFGVAWAWYEIRRMED